MATLWITEVEQEKANNDGAKLKLYDFLLRAYIRLMLVYKIIIYSGHLFYQYLLLSHQG